MDDLEKTIEHLPYAASSVVHHFIAIGEFKLEVHTGNAQTKCVPVKMTNFLQFKKNLFHAEWIYSLPIHIDLSFLIIAQNIHLIPLW